MKKILKIIMCILSCYALIGLGWITKDMIIHEQCKNGIPILGYHGVVEDQEKKLNYAHNTYFMSVSELEKQFAYLHDHQFQTLTMNEVNEYYHQQKQVPEKCVCITFDDGYKNFLTLVKPLLQKYNLKATCFVIGHKAISDNPLYLQKDELINDDYVQFYSHSYDLHHIAHLPKQKLIETLSVKEIQQDFLNNENIVSSDYFAFPYGVTSSNAKQYLASSQVKLAFGYNQNRTMTYHDNPYCLPRYQMFAGIPMFLFQWWIE